MVVLTGQAKLSTTRLLHPPGLAPNRLAWGAWSDCSRLHSTT